MDRATMEEILKVMKNDIKKKKHLGKL